MLDRLCFDEHGWLMDQMVHVVNHCEYFPFQYLWEIDFYKNEKINQWVIIFTWCKLYIMREIIVTILSLASMSNVCNPTYICAHACCKWPRCTINYNALRLLNAIIYCCKISTTHTLYTHHHFCCWKNWFSSSFSSMFGYI